MLVFRHGPRDLLVLDPMGVLYYVPMPVGIRGLCKVSDAVYAKFDYTLVFSTLGSVFRFTFSREGLAFAYRDNREIEPIVDFDKNRLVTEDGVFRGIRA